MKHRVFSKYTIHPMGDGESKKKISMMFNYDHIVDGVYIGTNACCIVHFSTTLTRKMIQADISLQDDRIDAAYGAKYFLWLPVKDHRAPTNGQFELGVASLDYFVRNGIKVYVHCKNGHGRAPTLVVAYLVFKGMPLGKALALVKERRPLMHLEEAQIKALGLFERKARQRVRRERMRLNGRRA